MIRGLYVGMQCSRAEFQFHSMDPTMLGLPFDESSEDCCAPLEWVDYYRINMNLSILTKIIRCGLAFHQWSAHRSDSYLWNPNIVAPSLATRHKLYSLRGRVCEPREFDNSAPFRLLGRYSKRSRFVTCCHNWSGLGHRGGDLQLPLLPPLHRKVEDGKG